MKYLLLYAFFHSIHIATRSSPEHVVFVRAVSLFFHRDACTWHISSWTYEFILMSLNWQGLLVLCEQQISYFRTSAVLYKIPSMSKLHKKWAPELLVKPKEVSRTIGRTLIKKLIILRVFPHLHQVTPVVHNPLSVCARQPLLCAVVTNTRHSWQNGTRCKSIVVSFQSCLVGFWGFHPVLLFRLKLFVTCGSTTANIRLSFSHFL